MPVCSDIQERLRRHEQWLISLRQDPDMTTAKIQTKLDNDKSLKATSSQLETFFRHLGQRKNLSRHEWISVFRALDSQKAFGNHYDLYISGKLITEQELRKKRKNAKPPQPPAEDPVVADRLIKQLPNGVTARKLVPRGSPSRSPRRSVTPQLLAHGLFDLNHDLGATGRLNSIAANSGRLPTPNHIVHDWGIGSNSVGPVLGSPSHRNESQFVSFSSSMEGLPTIQQSYDLMDIGMEDWNSFLALSPGSLDRLLGPLSPSASLRNFQYPDLASENSVWAPRRNYANPPNIPLNHGPHDHNAIESDILLLGESNSTSTQHEVCTSNALLPTAKDLFESLQSLILVDGSDGDYYGLLDVFNGRGAFTDQFIQMLLFSIVNNFAGLDSMPMDHLIKFINNHEPVRCGVLRLLRKGSSTMYSRALVEKLLKAAITACDARIVEDLLALKIAEPTEIKFTEEGRYGWTRRISAIEKAVKLRQPDIVEALLRFDAGVDRIDKSMLGEALESAIDHECRQEHSINSRLVELLLNNGATVQFEHIAAAVRARASALVERFMSMISPRDHQSCFDKLLTDAADLRNDIGHKFVHWVMRTCRDTHDSDCLMGSTSGRYYWRNTLVEAMWRAARRNNRDLVDLLLPYGGQRGLDMALTAAAAFGSHTLVRFLITHGASVNGEPYRLDVNGEPYRLDNEIPETTPLAEAIRHKDDELIEILGKEGAWNQIKERDRLKATLIAISESSNSALLHRVLGLVPAPDKDALDRAFFSAVKACNEEIALGLLDAGANPDNEYGDPLLEALRIKSHSVTWAILEFERPVPYIISEPVIEAAIIWADLEIIEALFFLGNGINNYRGRPPLSFAIDSGNRSIIDLMINRGADLSANPARESCTSTFNVIDGSEQSSSPLAAAVLIRDEATVRYLLDHGADPADEQAIINAIIHDRGMLTLILRAFQQRHRRGRAGFGGRALLHTLSTRDDGALDLCLSAGFDVNNMTYDKELRMYVSALGFAIRKYHNRLEAISKLLDAGGDVNLLSSGQTSDRVQSFRQTAFLDAIETRSQPLVELLISKGAQVQKYAKLGLKRTPLQRACEVGSHPIVELLIAHGADVNEVPAAGRGATALQLAAKAGSTRIAKRLLNLGAKVDAPGARIGGHSAIEYAAEYGRLDMIPLLFNAAGGKFVPEQCATAIALAKDNGHSVCAILLTELSARNQTFLDASGMADHVGRVSVSVTWMSRGWMLD